MPVVRPYTNKVRKRQPERAATTMTGTTTPSHARMLPLLIAFAVHVASGFVPLSSTTTTRSIPTIHRWSPSFATVANSTATFTQDIRKKTIVTKKAKEPKQRTAIRKVKASSSSSSQPRNNYNNNNNSKQPQKQKAKGDQYDQFQWLHWVYKQWVGTSPGELTDENVIRNMMAAIPRWSRRKSLENARRAEDILDRLIKESRAGNPHMRTIKDETTGETSLPPLKLSVSDFNAAMDGYGKIGNPAGVQRILRKMEALRGSSVRDYAHLQPDEFSMSTLASAWAKSHSDEAAQKAEAIIQYMDLKGLVPNTITYNAILHAIAVGNECDRALRAEDILQRMKHRHEVKGEDCQPDVYTYQSLIQAWSRTSFPGAPQKAEQILRFMDDEASSGKKRCEKLAPNAYCFTTVIHGWARSSENHRARHAYQLLNVMTRRYHDAKSKFDAKNTKRGKSLYKALEPNVKTYTSVLNACARPADESEKEDAFAIAQLTMAELSIGTYGKPNFLSYAAYLSVCATTLEPGPQRDAEARKTFEDCVNAGEVGQIVLEKLYTAASPSLWKELIGDHLDDVGHIIIPPQWSKSLKGERPVGNSFGKVELEVFSKIPKSSQQRLEDVQKFRGQSSIYSELNRSTTFGMGEDEISWSNDEFTWSVGK